MPQRRGRGIASQIKIGAWKSHEPSARSAAQPPRAALAAALQFYVMQPDLSGVTGVNGFNLSQKIPAIHHIVKLGSG